MSEVDNMYIFNPINYNEVSLNVGSMEILTVYQYCVSNHRIVYSTILLSSCFPQQIYHRHTNKKLLQKREIVYIYHVS